jgi:uncharacterized protein YrrD
MAETKNVRKGGLALRTFALIKGLPVIDVKSGTKIGEVSDLSVTGDGSVKGLIVKQGNLFKKTFLLRVENVHSYGRDGVMIENQDVLEQDQIPPEFTFEHHERLSGKMMLSKDGDQLGLLQDVYFLEEVGTIVGYELTDGFFSDITDGKRVIKVVDPPAIGKDAIVVNVENIVNEVSIDVDVPQLPE